ncbi:MAG: ABC transporter permease, partial [Candidatus Nanopelagicales bacterium]|nr:ABC transporter permease [Candidatus Nanopelagicales bacterium]
MSTTPVDAEPAERSQRLPSAVTLGVKRAGIEIKELMRDAEAAIFTVAFPILLLAIFGSIFNSEIAPGVTFSQYFVAAMIGSGIIYTGFQYMSISIPQERDDGTLKRLEGTPMPKSAYFIGKIGLVLVAYVVQVILLIVIGKLAFDISIPTEPAKILTFVWVSLLGLLCCVLLGLAFSSVPRTGKGASAVVTPVVLVLQFISGVFILYTQLPSWLQHVASVFPLKWMIQGMQSAFLPDSFAEGMTGTPSWELGKVALVLGAWTVAAAILAG